MSLAEAEAQLLTEKVQKKTFKKYNLTVLQALCSKYGLSVNPTGKTAKQHTLKADYIRAPPPPDYCTRNGIDERKSATTTHKSSSQTTIPTHAPRERLEIQLLEKPRDWDPIQKINYWLAQGESIDMRVLAQHFGFCHGECRVVDPKNRRPLYQYTPGVLESCDIEDMRSSGVLRVIWQA
ncbi:hypothetical protein QCA50_020531 [Cerrena zonata]|uniref:Uncharacterized protein n=1 Tax=Cerrena zonata TaxID=2478898 RepID=A0AAW0F901_9APHY